MCVVESYDYAYQKWLSVATSCKFSSHSDLILGLVSIQISESGIATATTVGPAFKGD